ncbi:glycosyltransferase [Thiocapsa bogorovii]|uniref:glycosyltransferase n=1 Tax=Thiocapsa bogorovii TaxID=521689 RepID=UPI001E3B2EC0|nr:glycosyltransferase [Thiocapsa bogorovii]UHD16892.1 glycosyltransferase [Thiocapsa bogorovii]
MNAHKYRILIITADLGMGGAQPMNVRLAHRLRTRGHTVRIVSLFPRADAINAEAIAGLEILRMNARGFLQKSVLPFRLARLAKLCHIIIGGAEHAATTYGYLASQIANVPFVSWTHIALSERIIDEGKPIDSAVSMAIYRRLRYVVFPSQGALDDLHHLLGQFPRNADWRAIPNFINKPAPLFKPPLPDAPSFSKPVVLSAGRFQSQKAFDRLIRAHAVLRGEGLDHHLVLLGDGPLRAALMDEARALGVQDSVFFPGHKADVSAWMAHACVFALCSRYEGFGLVILEALVAGTPVVAMDCPSGPAEILDDGRYGILTPHDDEAAFSAAIGRLLRDAGLRKALSNLGRERAEDYKPEKIVPQWEVLFDEISSVQSWG